MSRLLQPASQSCAPAPLPPYVPTTRRGVQGDEVLDLQFNLLRCFSGHFDDGTDFFCLFNPASYSCHFLDGSLAWVLFKVMTKAAASPISRLIDSDAVEDSENGEVKAIAKRKLDCIALHLDRLLIAQLEELDLWHWSVFVVLQSRIDGKLFNLRCHITTRFRFASRLHNA